MVPPVRAKCPDCRIRFMLHNMLIQRRGGLRLPAGLPVICIHPCAHVCCTVKLCLDQPLVGPPDLRKLLALCAIADANVERAVRMNRVNERAEAAVHDVEQACSQVSSGQAPLVR